jgi:hypothetical protein
MCRGVKRRRRRRPSRPANVMAPLPRGVGAESRRRLGRQLGGGPSDALMRAVARIEAFASALEEGLEDLQPGQRAVRLTWDLEERDYPCARAAVQRILRAPLTVSRRRMSVKRIEKPGVRKVIVNQVDVSGKREGR